MYNASGVIRPVLSGEEALLSLGRAVVADPSWIGPSFPGGLTASVTLGVWRDGVPRRGTKWRLFGIRDPDASRWLQEMAVVLCQPPSTSFVRENGLCSGVKPPPPSSLAAARAGGRRVAEVVGLGAAHSVRATEMSLRWRISRTAQPAPSSPCPPSFGKLNGAMTLQQPIWLLGRGSRELHVTGPRSEAELALAARLSSCYFNETRNDLMDYTYSLREMEALTYDLSQRYQRSFFRKDPPAPPTTNVELLLAVIVVVPEAFAVLLLLLQRRGAATRRSPQHEALALVVVVAAGAVALLGVGFLDKQEQDGHAWRAATVQRTTRIPVNATEHARITPTLIHYEGRYVFFSEVLFVTARTGYRTHLTRALLVSTAVVYAALTVAAVAQAVRTVRPRRRRRRRRPPPQPVVDEERVARRRRGNGVPTEGGEASPPLGRLLLPPARRRWLPSGALRSRHDRPPRLPSAGRPAESTATGDGHRVCSSATGG